MKNWIFLLLFLVLLDSSFLFSQPTNPCGLVQSIQYEVNSDNGVNLREEPSVNGKILIAVPNNKILLSGSACETVRDKVDNKRGNWIKTSYNDKVGFVWDRFLKKTKKETTIIGQYGDYWEANNKVSTAISDLKYYGLFFTFKKSQKMNNYFQIKEITKDDLMIDPSENSFGVDYPIFIISGLKIDTNIIKGNFINKMLFPGDQVRIPNFSKTYILYALGNLERNKEDFPLIKSINNYELRFFEAENNIENKDWLLFKSTIRAWGAGGYEDQIYVKWVGDLNSDDRLDFLVGYSSHYAGGTYKLYLSNSESGDEMYKEISMGRWGE